MRLIITLSIIAAIVAACVLDDRNAMATCQQTHSYDVCVHSLHR